MLSVHIVFGSRFFFFLISFLVLSTTQDRRRGFDVNLISCVVDDVGLSITVLYVGDFMYNIAQSITSTYLAASILQ